MDKHVPIILVVEDSELQREVLCADLEEQGLRVLQAETGAAARQIVDGVVAR